MPSAYTLGSYRLIAELGHGGMANVFLAAVQGPVGSGFTKLAVVKKLRSNLAEDPEFVSMLLDEARITARLNHPNVVQLFEVGEIDGQYFLAMEYLEGQPLHRIERRLSQSGTDVPREVFYAVVSDALAGLHHAHELADYDGTPLEVAHRDVTPHNVFVRYDGTVKVVDFGIAKAIGRACETQRTTLKGKVRYMSPEQACGDHVDRRTDIFAAGVILWNMATGMKFWGESTDAEIVEALCAGHFVASPRERCPEVPEEIDAICRRALAFDRAERYGTADEMRADLEAFLGRGSAEARKKLAAMMKDLFEVDRAKVRAVVEASSLMSVASLDAFTAAAGVIAPRVHVTALETRSVTPVLVSTAPVRATPGPRTSRLVSALAIAAAMMTFAVAWERGATHEGSTAVRAGMPAVVVSELTSSSSDVREKAELTPSSVARKSATRSAASATGATTSTGSSAVSSPPPSEGPKAARKRAALDASDPWVSGSTDPALR